MKIADCLDCGETGSIQGRGLCAQKCYRHHQNRHTLDKFPRTTWKRAELLAEFDLCRVRGLTVREAAEKIGVTYSALARAIQRARDQQRRANALWDLGNLEAKIN